MLGCIASAIKVSLFKTPKYPAIFNYVHSYTEKSDVSIKARIYVRNTSLPGNTVINFHAAFREHVHCIGFLNVTHLT